MSGQGTVTTHRMPAGVLAGNPLGDPAERDVTVYLPPGYDAAAGPYPVLLAVVGFTGTGAMLFSPDPLGEPLQARLDRLIGVGECPPVIVAAPDAFTRVGGNQYLNSVGTGRYEDWLVDEVVPFVHDRYACGEWGVFGKSSGGYGAIVLGMRRPDVFRAVADHSGDANFELCYLPDMSAALDAFREAGGVETWLDAYWKDENRRRARHLKPLICLAMAAHYSPNPDAPLGLDFPFDYETGVFRPDVWERWREWDPVNMVPRHAEALRSLKLVYLDCGTKDEWHLHWGARALADAIRGVGVEPVHEEFDDGHGNLGYRYDRSLPLLAKALS